MDISIRELRKQAVNLENEAKKEKQNKNYKKSAELFLEASKIYEKIGDERNKKWNLANYYSIMAKEYSLSKEFDKAREFYKKAEELFLELGIKKPGIKKVAMNCFYHCLRTYIFEEKINNKNPKKYLELLNKYLSEAEQFLEKYKEFSETREYLYVKLDYLKRLSIKHRKFEGNLDKAIELTEKCYKLAEELYNKFGDKNFKRAEIFNKHIYYNLMAQKFENEKKFKEAAEYYKKSGDIIREIDEKIAYDEYGNSYKWLAIDNKYDKEKFEEYIDKAIEFTKKRDDKQQEYYYLGLKYDHLVKFANTLEEKIEYIKKSKEYYYKSKNFETAKYMEYLEYYYQSKYELLKRNYEKALNFLQKAKKSLKNVKISNIIFSKYNLKCDELIYNFYLRVSQGEFKKSVELLDEYLKMSSNWKNTKKYRFYEYLKCPIEILSKESFSKDDLLLLEDMIQDVRNKKISLTLYRICSLTYAYVSLWMHNIRDKEVLEKIKLEIIKRITTEEVSRDLENKIKIQMAMEREDWLLRLPPAFVEKFDNCVYFLEEVLDEFRHTAYREFYTLLENYLKIIVEFNAFVLWGENWKQILEEKMEKIANTKKPFEKFAFGYLLQSLRLLKNEGCEFCKNISDEILELLDKHVSIRNDLSHKFNAAIPEDIDIREDTLKIMYGTLEAFPICIRVINDKKKPWYSVEVIWNQIPKKVSLYSNTELKKGCLYYIEPYSNILDKNKMHPKIIIPIEVSKDIVYPNKN
jgi:tetratricopeptide (TPR) repeat protein